MLWVRLTQQQEERRFGADDGLLLAMARFYSSPQSRKAVKMVERGLLVAVEGSDGVVRRARVQVLGNQKECSQTNSMDHISN